MEHELFQSKLKPLVDATLLPRTIRSSSSGESPHRAAAMVSIFGRSIQKYRERVSTDAKNALLVDPTTQPKNSDALDISIPQVQSPVRTRAPTPAPVSAPTQTPIHTPRLPSSSSPNPSVDFSARPGSPSVKCEASLGSPTLSAREIPESNDDPVKIVGDNNCTQKVTGRGRKKKNPRNNNRRGPSSEETLTPPAKDVIPMPDKNMVLTPDKDMLPPADTDVIPSADKDVVPSADNYAVPSADKDMAPPPSKGIVQLACWTCNVKQPRNNLRSGYYCNLCFGPAAMMRCVGCRTIRIRHTETCIGCGGRFE